MFYLKERSNLSWPHTEAYAYITLLSYSVATCCILFLGVRHILMLQNKLLPSEKCSACFTVLFSRETYETAETGEATTLGRVSVTDGIPDRDVHKRLATKGTIATCVLFLLFCLGVVAMYLSADGFNVIPVHICKYGATLNAFLYSSAKVSLYIVFVARLHIGFKDLHAYDSRFIKAMYAITSAVAMVVLALILLYVRGESGHYKRGTREEANDSNVVKECTVDAPLWLLASPWIFDAMFTLLAVFLFVRRLHRPLRQFMKEESETVQEMTADMFVVPIKYMMISLASVCVTIFSVALVLGTGASFVFAFGTVFDCLALLMMTSHWKPVYVRLFAPLTSLVVIVPCLGLADLSEVELMQEVALQQKVAPIVQLETIASRSMDGIVCSSHQ